MPYANPSVRVCALDECTEYTKRPDREYCTNKHAQVARSRRTKQTKICKWCGVEFPRPTKIDAKRWATRESCRRDCPKRIYTTPTTAGSPRVRVVPDVEPKVVKARKPIRSKTPKRAKPTKVTPPPAAVTPAATAAPTTKVEVWRPESWRGRRDLRPRIDEEEDVG